MSGIGKIPSGPPCPWVTPLPTSPRPGGGEKTQGEGEKAARPASLFGDFPIRAPPPCQP